MESCLLHQVYEAREYFTQLTKIPWEIVIGDLHRRRVRFLHEQLEEQHLVSLERECSDVYPSEFILFTDGGGKAKDWKNGGPLQGCFALSWAAPGGATLAEGLGPMFLPGYLEFDECVDTLSDPGRYVRAIPFAALSVTSASSEMTAMLMWGLFILAHWDDERVIRMIQRGKCRIVFDNAMGPDLMTGHRGSTQEPGLHYLLRGLGVMLQEAGLEFTHHLQHSHAEGEDIVPTWGQLGNMRVDRLADLGCELRRVLANWGTLDGDDRSGAP